MRILRNGLMAKLVAVISVGMLMLMAAYGYAAYRADRAIQQYENLINLQINNERQILHIQTQFKIQVQEWKDTLIRGKDPAMLKKYWGKFSDKEDWVHRRTEQLLATMQNQEAKGLLKRFLQAHEHMSEAYRSGFDGFKSAGFNTQAGDRLVKGIDREPTQLLGKAAAVLAKSVATASASATTEAQSAMRSSAILVALVVILSFVSVVMSIRGLILKPIDVVVAGLGRLASGDFTTPVHLNRSDEIGQLAKSTEHIRKELGFAIGQVVESSDTLAKEAAQLANVSATTTRTVAEQHHETDMVATSINEMTATVSEVARSAAYAAESAQKADAQAGEGQRTVSETVERIDSLATETERSAKAINKLNEDSQNISGVLEVIHGVAEQTNLLALNAAIEAARAGENGRGFAVVADEVRTLAQRTQQSTQEIQSLIEELQQGSGAAVKAMNDNLVHAKDAVAQARHAGEALMAITDAVGQISDMNTQIASASEEQGAVAEEINRNIHKISQIAEGSAGGAKQITSVSAELSGLAGRLKQLTQGFTL